jgi:hypothetical protein
LPGTSYCNAAALVGHWRTPPARKTKGGTLFYAVSDLLGLQNADAPTVCYARVSSPDQKEDLERQQAMLEAYCAAKGWRTETIKDLGFGMNYRDPCRDGRHPADHQCHCIGWC